MLPLRMEFEDAEEYVHFLEDLATRDNAGHILAWFERLGHDAEELQAYANQFRDETDDYKRKVATLQAGYADWLDGIANVQRIIKRHEDEVDDNIRTMLRLFQVTCQEEGIKVPARARVCELREKTVASFDEYVARAVEAKQMTRRIDGRTVVVLARDSLQAVAEIEAEILVRVVLTDAIIYRFRLDE